MGKKSDKKVMGDLSMSFEDWLRYTLPWQLNLSPSKQVAVEMIFCKFADFARLIAEKSPKEFETFFDELKNRANRVAKWRALKNTKITPILFQGKPECFPNGKYRYFLIEKKRKIAKI